jgi:hypothetical protein
MAMRRQVWEWAMLERRREHRKRCYLGARIEFNNRRSTMDCLVRDESGGGARLVITESVTVPAEFDLVLKDRDRRDRAELAWRRGDLVGVRMLRAG